MTNASEVPDDKTLKRYDTVMAHLRYDHSIFWTRFGFMMVSQIAALGFFINTFVLTMDSSMPLAVLCRTPFCAIGLFLVWQFNRLRKTTHWWISR